MRHRRRSWGGNGAVEASVVGAGAAGSVAKTNPSPLPCRSRPHPSTPVKGSSTEGGAMPLEGAGPPERRQFLSDCTLSLVRPSRRTG